MCVYGLGRGPASHVLCSCNSQTIAIWQALTGKSNLSATSTLGTPLELAAARGHDMAVEYLVMSSLKLNQWQRPFHGMSSNMVSNVV